MHVCDIALTQLYMIQKAISLCFVYDDNFLFLLLCFLKGAEPAAPLPGPHPNSAYNFTQKVIWEVCFRINRAEFGLPVVEVHACGVILGSITSWKGGA